MPHSGGVFNLIFIFDRVPLVLIFGSARGVMSLSRRLSTNQIAPLRSGPRCFLTMWNLVARLPLAAAQEGGA